MDISSGKDDKKNYSTHYEHCNIGPASLKMSHAAEEPLLT